MSKKKEILPPTMVEVMAHQPEKVDEEGIRDFEFNCGISEVSMETNFSGNETRQQLIAKLAALRLGNDFMSGAQDTMIGTTVDSTTQQKAITAMLKKHGYKPVVLAKPDGTAMYLWVLLTHAVRAKKKAVKKKK